MRRLLLLVTFLSLNLFAVTATSQTKIQKTDEGFLVIVSHALTPDGTLTSVFLNQGQILRIWITDTNLQCFTYNAAVAQAPLTTTFALDGGGPPPNTAELVVTHDEDVSAYSITVAKINQTGCESPKVGQTILGNRTWTIPVKGRWNLAVSGAYSADGLTDRGFYLEPGTQKGQNGAADKQGNYIREDKNAQDRAQWSPSLMAHIYQPGRMWVPFTFGVTTDTNNMKVYLGTGIRFLNKLYVTTGYVNGPRKRLPAGVHVGDFSEQANVLTDMPKRNTGSWFLGISLSFFDHSLGTFQNLVKAPQPASTGGAAKPQPQSKPQP